jgi:hypothetical protein
MRNFITDFGKFFSIALIVGLTVTLVWSLLTRSAPVDWGAAFRMALVLAVVLAFLEGRKGV